VSTVLGSIGVSRVEVEPCDVLIVAGEGALGRMLAAVSGWTTRGRGSNDDDEAVSLFV
jgi:hypothetical protein